MTPARDGERTLICSVVFADLVGHTKKSVTSQATSKRRFIAHLDAALADMAATERIVLDTGDGAAIGFLADPEDALYAAIALRDGVQRQAEDDALSGDTQEHPPDSLRIGINLGPVKLVCDVNGQRNLVGDGINFAQRIMGFAEPDEILASRAFHEVIACMSADFTSLFRYVGPRADKHVREHEVFVLGECARPFEQLAAGVAARAAHRTAIAARSVRAIIAEDEPILREELRELLSAIWPELEIIAEAANGLAALQAIESLKPDIAFLDIQMPRMTGIEVARAVNGRVHVVMATAFDHHAINAFDAGAIDYVLKPYQPARLVATCQRIKQRMGIVAGRPVILRRNV